MPRRLNLKDDLYLKLMLYGQAGATKTRTAGTAVYDERTHPVLWLDIGGNPTSLRSYDPIPDIIEISELVDFNPIYDWLAAGQPESQLQDAWDIGRNGKYKTVVIDGLTGTQRLSFAKVTGNLSPKPGSYPPDIQIQHYNKVLSQMTWLGALFFYKLPMHVIMTALEREDLDGRTGMLMYKPLLLGQSAGELPGQALAVARMTHFEKTDSRTRSNIKEPDVTSVALFKQGMAHVAKDQYGGLPDVMPNPTITKILDAINIQDLPF